MADELVPAVDVERQTIRGRMCPRCGGKIIPSDRAVYQSTTDPSDVFQAWQCERCGYEELSEKKPPGGEARPPAEEEGRRLSAPRSRARAPESVVRVEEA